MTKPARSNRMWLWPLLTLAVAGLLMLGDRWRAHRKAESGGRAVFEVLLDGTTIGQEQMVYDADPDASTARLTTSSELTLSSSTMHVKSEATLTLPDFVLTRYRVTNTGRMSMAEFALDRRDGHFQFSTSGSVGGRDSELPAQPDAALLDNNIASHYQLLAWRWRRTPGGKLTCPVVIPQVGKVFEGIVERAGTWPATLKGRPITARCLCVTVGPLTADVWVEEGTANLLRVVLQGTHPAEYRRLDLTDLPGNP